MINGSLKVSRTAYFALQTPSAEGPWPLLLALHGYGQSAPEMALKLQPLASAGILVAAPQAPNHFYLRMRDRRVGFTWLTRYQRDESMADIVDYLHRFLQLLDRDYAIDFKRLYLLGFSQGVSIAYRFWVHGKHQPAGLFACGADLPPDVEQRLGDVAPMPVHILHGTRDELVPMQKPRHAQAKLTEAGFPVEFRRFDAAHEISPEMIGHISTAIVGRPASPPLAAG